ncbi:hypothetical protein LIA77_03213 [Sarocladium implicatum]|nr:hypothetical protein LIA77_03213 [Sarocladium implicatum]
MKVAGLLPIAAFLVNAASANYICTTSRSAPTITDDIARQAVVNGGTNTNTKSRFPHGFAGMTGNGTPGDYLHDGWKIYFYGADPRCNADQPENPDESGLLEFPVFASGKSFNKDAKRGEGVLTPVRVIYLREDMTMCGVITHVIENDDGSGAGDFRYCDST